MTTVTLRERKKTETRRRLSRTALALFEQRGVEAVTIEEIAAEAAIGKGTVYNYYRSKDDILIEFLASVEAQALAAIANPRTKDRAAAQVLNQAAWSLLACKAEHYRFARLVLARVVSGDADFRARTRDFSAAIITSFTAMFEKMKRDGLIGARCDSAELALQFTVMHMGLSAFWANEGPPFANAKRIARRQTEIFANGLAS